MTSRAHVATGVLMRRTLVLLAVGVTAACGPRPPSTPVADRTATPPARPPADAAARSTESEPARGAGQVVRGVVAETLNSGGYTYVRLASDRGDTDRKSVV